MKNTKEIENVHEEHEKEEILNKKRKRSTNEEDNYKKEDFVVLNDASNLTEEDKLKCIYFIKKF